MVRARGLASPLWPFRRCQFARKREQKAQEEYPADSYPADDSDEDHERLDRAIHAGQEDGRQTQ